MFRHDGNHVHVIVVAGMIVASGMRMSLGEVGHCMCSRVGGLTLCSWTLVYGAGKHCSRWANRVVLVTRRRHRVDLVPSRRSAGAAQGLHLCVPGVDVPDCCLPFWIIGVRNATD